MFVKKKKRFFEKVFVKMPVRKGRMLESKGVMLMKGWGRGVFVAGFV
jgi:hypothetical protein